MRKIIFIAALLVSTTAFAQQKHALIVAVGKYMPGSNISPIASVNDIKYIKAVLDKNGFPASQIDSLKDAQATKAAILRSLDALAARVNKNDIVLIHFSMHGQQIRDQKDAGRDEDDGFDEALIPYDVKKPQYFPGVYTGENHLRDDDLAPKLNAIRNKLGADGSLLVLIDACHSGTATRASELAISRGEPQPFLDPENPMETFIARPLKDNFFDELTEDASNMVVISGSGPHQQNFQSEVNAGGHNEQVGSLSYGFYKAMNDLEKDSDYDALFRRIKAFIQAQHPSQIPMIEGNTRQVVFSGKYNPKKEIIQLFPLEQADTLFSIDKGVMDGMVVGAVIEIYMPGGTTSLGKGYIERTDHFKAYGRSSIALKKGIAYEARTAMMHYGPFGTTLKFKTGKSRQAKEIEKKLRAAFKSLAFITISDQASLMIDLDSMVQNKRQVQLVDAIDSTRWQKELDATASLSDADVAELVMAIKNTIRLRYLRTLPDGGDLLPFVKVEIIPAAPREGNEMVLGPGEDYALKIVNSSDEKLFYTVLDITPDNKVSVLYPTPVREAADYMVEKNSQVTRKLGVSRNTPSGREFLKVIVSREPLDLRSVLEHTRQRAEMTSFQVVLDDLFGDNGSNTRAISGVKADEIGIVTASFMVTSDK